VPESIARLRAGLSALAVASVLALWRRTRLGKKWSFPWAQSEHPDRHVWPESVLIERYLDAKPGMKVADVGAGAGYWTFRLAEAVGSQGTVLAVDSDLDACLKLLYEKRRRRAENVRVKWVGRRNPRLNPSAVDLILIIDAHLFVETRRERGRRYLGRCAAALRPGGRILVFNRSVRLREWVPDFGRPLGYDESTPEQVAALAAPRLDLEACERLPVGGRGPARGELPGYLLVLRTTP
jgi:SAM-dependent methyltransferase